MNKIDITSNIKAKYRELVFSIFKNNRLKRKDKQKIKSFDIDLSILNKIISKKLNKFDKNIDFEKLILADFNYLKELTEYIDKNSKTTQLSQTKKEYFYTLYSRLKKSEYVKLLDVTTCLYCNRNYIFNFTKNNKLEATAQIDHFFDKKTYPYLAVSLYNLIPSCSTCNQRKSTKKEEIIHPFVESFDKVAKFNLKIINSNFYYRKSGFDISFETTNKKALKSIEVFNLQNLYQNHKDIILELIQKEVIYNDSYLDELFRNYEGTLFKNKEDLQRLISGGFIEDSSINKRPLSKLIKDISLELEL